MEADACLQQLSGAYQLPAAQGVFVADSLYFRGDGIGQVEQRKSVPALPAPGYDHDNLSLDALLHQVSVRDHRFVLPNRAGYKTLVFSPGTEMPMEALAKIRDLVDRGAVVVGPRPSNTSGLQDALTSRRFHEIVASLWDQDSLHHVIDGSATDGLAKLKLAPDISFAGLSKDGDLDWLHRTSGDTEIYFLASRWDSPEKVSATFRVRGKQPELWDRITGEIRTLPLYTQHDGMTTVPLEFNPGGSFFVVFRKRIPTMVFGTAVSNYPVVTPLETIDGPWQVNFDLKWGGPATASFPHLTDWTERLELGIRYYSGTAVYNTKFSISHVLKKGESLLLDLGTVHEVASVKLNGRSLEVVWTRPSTIDVSCAARAGSNRLEIMVVNL